MRKQYREQTFHIVITEGEIVNVFKDAEEAEGYAYYVNEDNVDNEIVEAGYDPEELDEDEIAEFAFSAGYNSGYTYSEEIRIPEEFNEDDIMCTSQGDEISYSEIILAINKYRKED